MREYIYFHNSVIDSFLSLMNLISFLVKQSTRLLQPQSSNKALPSGYLFLSSKIPMLFSNQTDTRPSPTPPIKQSPPPNPHHQHNEALPNPPTQQGPAFGALTKTSQRYDCHNKSHLRATQAIPTVEKSLYNNSRARGQQRQKWFLDPPP